MKQKLKRISADIAGRIFMLVVMFTYPLFAIVALPWAWLASIDVWGHTAMEDWKEGWSLYSPTSLKSAWDALVEPIR